MILGSTGGGGGDLRDSDLVLDQSGAGGGGGGGGGGNHSFDKSDSLDMSATDFQPGGYAEKLRAEKAKRKDQDKAKAQAEALGRDNARRGAASPEADESLSMDGGGESIGNAHEMIGTGIVRVGSVDTGNSGAGVADAVARAAAAKAKAGSGGRGGGGDPSLI